MESDRLLKGLKTQAKNKLAELELIKIRKKSIEKEYNTKRKEITQLNRKIENIVKNSDVTVSEHAILRYLERIEGINIEEIKEKILTEQIKDLVKQLGGSGKYPNSNFQVVMKNFTVTTVID